MTFTANQRLVIVLSFLACLIGVGIVSYAAGASDERAIPLSERVLTECDVVDLEFVNTDVTAVLMTSGWTGRPNDGREALYSPACN